MQKALVAALLLTSSSLLAQTFLRVSPAAPDDATPIQLQMGGPVLSGCELLPPRVEVTGVTIRVRLETRSIPCPAVTTPWNTVADVGKLPAGVYDVVVDTNGREDLRQPLGVRQASPPFEVRPNVGWLGQGVRLTGNDLSDCSGATCTKPTVLFGTTEATVWSATSAEIWAVVPPVPATTPLDVTIRNSRGGVTAKAAFGNLYGVATPSLHEFLERVLFPTLYSGGGLRGSVWKSEAVMHNASADPVTSPSQLFFHPCQPPCDGRVQPDTTTDGAANSYPNGVVYTLPRQIEHDVWFSLRIRDLSRAADELGTLVPVIREEEFYDRPFRLLNITDDRRYRSTLRVYALGGPRTARILIRRHFSAGVVVNFTFSTVESVTGGSAAPRGELSVYTIPDLISAFPQLDGWGPLMIEITPGPGAPSPMWAMVSMTNNETQHVTISTPE